MRPSRPGTLRLDDDFSITITGRVYHVLRRRNAGGDIGNLIERLLTGEEIPESDLHSWQLTIEDARPREKLMGPKGRLP